MSDRKPYERPNSEMTLGEELAAHVAEYIKNGVVNKIAAKARTAARKGEMQICSHEITEEVAELLREQGLKVWYDTPDERNGNSGVWVVDWSKK